jgi:signal transduction histidine kinase
VVRFYRNTVAFLGLFLWILLALIYPLPDGNAWIIVLAVSFFLAFTYTFPIEIYNTPIGITHIIFLGTGIAYGPGVAIWSALIGIGVGTFTRAHLRTYPHQPAASPISTTLTKSLFELSLLILPFVFSNALINWQESHIEMNAMLNIMGTYILAHATFVCLDLWIKAFSIRLSIRQILLTLLIIELAPLPFLLVSLSASAALKNLTPLVFIAGLPAMLSIFLYDAEKSRAGLERRVQDLSLLNQISEVISRGTDLNSLLQAIQTQITELLGVNNFYIALLDPKTHSIWYPIAIKDGDPQEWAHRAPSNRLTDRVIKDRTPLLLADNIDKQLSDIGADPDSGELKAWLGVPLQTPEGMSGCMAVFSLSERTFTDDDLKLLTTLSGQVGSALQTALNQEKAGHRLSRQAEQLNILDQISRQLSATLQSDHLFNLILKYALDFTQSPAGSITIFNSMTTRYEVKAQQGYPEDYEPETVQLENGDAQTARPLIKHAQDKAGSQMSVPITYGGEVIGAIFLESPRRDEYTRNELNFVSQLAQQASQAIRNSNLYEETQRRLREQSTLATIVSQLASNKDLDVVANRVVQAFSALLDSAYSGIYLWNVESEVFELKTVMQRNELLEITLPRQISLKDWRKMQHDQTAASPLRVTHDEGNPAQIIKMEKAQQVLFFPLEIGGQPIGLVANHLISIDPVPTAELEVPRTVAAQSAIAIQNAMLFSRVSAGRDRLQAVLNSVGDCVLMVNESGRIMLANTPLETLTNSTDLRGKLLSTMPVDFLNKLGMTRAEAERFNSAEPLEQPVEEFSLSHRFQAKDRFYERFTAQVWGELERSSGWIIVVRDVTEEFQVNQTRELLTETLVHDLRSPIGAIKTTLELLEENLPSEEQDAVVIQSLDIANRSTKRVLSLIESLLDISHLESGEIELSTRPIDLKPLLLETVEEMIPLATEDQVILNCQLPESLPHVLADPSLIRRVLINLIDNSLKFTPEGGLVTVFTEPNGDEKIHVCISDTGMGIPDEYRQEVFARFSQVPGTRGRRRGSGLGLTFCRLAIEAHHEKIWIRDSENEKGVTLVFSLPITTQHTN